MFEQRSRQFRLPDNAGEHAPFDGIMKRNGNRVRGVLNPFFDGCRVDGSRRIHSPRARGKLLPPKELEAYPTGTSTCVTNTSLRNRGRTSDRSAVSKKRERASTRFALASSIEDPWLAMSSSGHSDTNPSSSRSMIAVKRGDCVMIRVYNRSKSNAPGGSDLQLRPEHAAPVRRRRPPVLIQQRRASVPGAAHVQIIHLVLIRVYLCSSAVDFLPCATP